MQMLQSLFYLTTALHVSGFTITHLQEHKTTVTTASGNRYTVLLSVAIVEELEPVWVCCGWRRIHSFLTSVQMEISGLPCPGRFSPLKQPRYELGGPQSRYRRFEKNKKFLIQSGLEPRIVQSWSSLYTELWWLWVVR